MVLNLTGGNANQTYYGDQVMSFMGTLSPPSSSMDSSDISMSPGLVTSQLLYQIENLNTIIENGEPMLHIIEQPVEKFRFRYRSEMSGTHGSLNGINSDKLRKNTYPTVQLLNYSGLAIIRCSIYQVDVFEPHPHRLIIKDSRDAEKDDPHDIQVSHETNHTAVFQGMGIIHTAKVNLIKELFQKKKNVYIQQLNQKGIFRELTKHEIADIKHKAEQEAKNVNLNIVRLRFDAFQEVNNVLIPICDPVYSNGINNLKSALTGELKIVRMDLTCGSCLGGQEIFMLVEKVVKSNIQIRFFQCDEDDNEIWCDFGKFSPVDVHHQYAIVFKTPPYRDTNIDSVVEVCIELVRPSDGGRSEPRIYKYKPSDKIGRKRFRCNDSIPSSELPATISNLLSHNNESTILNSNDTRDIDSIELSRLVENYLTDYEEIVKPDTSLFNTTDGPIVPTKIGSSPNQDEMLAKNIHKQLACVVTNKEKINPDIVENLAKKLFNELKTNDGNNAIHTSILHEQFQQLQYFLILLSNMKHLKILDIKNNDGDAPLHIAVKINNAAVVRSLLNAGADPNIVNNDGNTPLHLSIKFEHFNIIDDLITSENVDKENHDGKTPLLLAVLNKNLDCVERLVDKKANVNKLNNSNGFTILHYAIEGQCVDIVDYLLRKTKARYDIPNFNQITPYQLSKILSENNDVRSKEIYKIMTKYLQEYGLLDLFIKSEINEEEDSDADVKIEPLSPVNMDVDCDIQLTKEVVGELSKILDNSPVLSKLSKELKFSYVGEKLNTKMLFTYVQIDEIPITRVLSVLKQLNVPKAVKILEDFISKNMF